METLRQHLYEIFKSEQIKNVHFIGIAGIGMSGIAKIMFQLGFNVQGSDIQQNYVTEMLKKESIRVYQGHSTLNVKDAEVVVFSSGIKKNNPEYQEALRLGKKLISRGDMLALLLQGQSNYCIAGAHGKTTTTAMVAKVFFASGLEPTVINGGFLNGYYTNALLGNYLEPKKNYCVVETDESDGSFLSLPVKNAIVINIDQEHLEHYKSFDVLLKAFVQFIEKVPKDGIIVLNIADRYLKQLLESGLNTRGMLLTYELVKDIEQQNENSTKLAFSLGSKFHIVGCVNGLDDDGMLYSFVLNTPDMVRERYQNLHLGVYGEHNVENALAVIAISAYNRDLKLKKAIEGLKNFQGVKRRFSKIGYFQGAQVIDDYAHHPKEISVSLNTARQILEYTGKSVAQPGKLIAVVQPHRYSRVKYLIEDFARALVSADFVILLPLYATGESPIPDVNSDKIYEHMVQLRKGERGLYLLDESSVFALKRILEQIKIQNNDIILCMGAGDITNLAKEISEYES